MTTLPVFPLNAVIFPGVVTPLHIFEDRYRALMRDLLAIDDPADRIFAIVAIREGYEVGEHGMQSMHRTGTLVQLTESERYDDGRFDIEVTGRQRVVLNAVDSDGEYLRAECDLVADSDEDPSTAAEAVRTLSTFEEYRDQLSDLRGGPVLAGPMPHDPTYLSYSLAATCLLSQAERQEMLEAPDAVSRLRMVRHSLREEMRAMRALPSLPATEIARTRWSPN
ncbi:peptidase S16 [Nocardioides marmoriginsengisoli]|uniref:Peptidase S16 n=1 Tax=Nocardioides marmoriginsengisoli TaxID=661483 RepID=A0A3N0CQ09_9ACTN|nr:LON peptidase substrate-binding domain-containing protein [Nocardioides marmoriginsengisoli]RNL64983.1 peptidase S16 [Nocardioides marmoriginsengisoli]